MNLREAVMAIAQGKTVKDKTGEIYRFDGTYPVSRKSGSWIPAPSLSGMDIRFEPFEIVEGETP